MKDCHVHTNISYNGISTISEYLEEAKEKNIDEITFTEHYDIQNGRDTLDIDYYLNEYIKYFKDSRAKTNFGLEIDLHKEKLYRISDTIVRYPFDFIVGSFRIDCKKDMLFDSSFFDGYTRHEVYLNYFREVLDNIKAYDNEYDVYSGFDYILRYGEYPEKRINYENYKDILDEILIDLIKKNKGIEINTSGIRYGIDNVHPNINILKRYKELGGKIVTIGSDAHKASNLGCDFDIAINMLQEVGFDEVAVYHKRKPDFVKIKDFTINH